MEPDRGAEIRRAMSTIVGDEHVLVDPDQRAGYEIDWTGRYSGPCAAVVRPGSVGEVAAVLRHCSDHSIAVVPQAGNTGLVGGGVPRPRDPEGRPTIVMSVRRLDAVGEVDPSAMQVTTGAGVTITGWQQAARAAGFDTPIDFAARESATIGGAIATNAGGSRVVRYGTMRQQVIGIEAVLADGTIVGSLAGLPKETVGLHWPAVITGSEGTLAVVTAARLRVVPHFAHVTTALVSLDDLDAARELLAELRRRLASLDSIEIVFPPAMALVADHLGTASPVAVHDRGVVVLIECADHVDPTDDLLTEVGGASGVRDTAVATGGTRRHQLVAFRDRLTEAIAAAATREGTPVFKLDVAVPVGSIERVLDVAQQAADRQGALLIPFGHLAEGNLHLNVLGATAPEQLADAVLAEVADLGGTISAEHGVGIAKTHWLGLIRRPGDLAAQQAIKRSLDPHGILNPGVLAPPA